MSHGVRSWLSAAALTVAALSGASCKKPATGLRVLVTTDFSPSSTTPPLHSVIVRVSDVRTGAELIADTINVLDGAATLPLKFSVFLTTAASDRVRIEAEAHTVDTQANPRNPDGSTRALTAARVVTGFVEGQIRVVPLVLYRGCWDARLACTPDTTCGPSAMCESANRDPNTLPAFDRDAGDPTDVFTPASDAATASEAGSDGAMDATADGATDSGVIVDTGVRPDSSCALPAPMMLPVSIASPEAPDPKLLSIVTRPSMPAMMMDAGAGGATVELLWAGPRSMSNSTHVYSAGLSKVAGVYGGRRLATMGAPLSSGSIATIALGTTTNEVGALSLSSTMMMMPPTLSGALVATDTGLQAPTGFNPPPAWPWANVDLSNSALLLLDNTPTVAVCSVPNAGTRMPCYVADSRGMSRTFNLDFGALSLARARLVGFVVASRAMPMMPMMPLAQVLLELADGQGYARCESVSTIPPGGEGSGVNMTCVTTQVVGGSVRPGSLSAHWIPDGMCGTGARLAGGWYGALAQIVGGVETIVAGALDVASTGALPIRYGSATDINLRTAVSVAPMPCEMMIARATGTSLSFVRATLDGASVSPASTPLVIDGNSVVRSTAQAPPSAAPGMMPTGDDHLFAFIQGSGVYVATTTVTRTCPSSM